MTSNQYSSRRNIVKAPIVCKPSPSGPAPTATGTLLPNVLELSVNTFAETVLTIADPSKPAENTITLTYTQEAGVLAGAPDVLNNASTTLTYNAPAVAGNFQIKIAGRYPDGTIVIVFGLAIVVLD